MDLHNNINGAKIENLLWRNLCFWRMKDGNFSKWYITTYTTFSFVQIKYLHIPELFLPIVYISSGKEFI